MGLLLVVALASLGLDLGSKWLAAQFLQDEAIHIGGFLRLECTQNTGMAFGMMAGNIAANLLLPLAVILAGGLLMRHYRSTAFTRAACGLILGGFAGNFAQRLVQGYVLDMIYFPWLPFFVCNVADICICFGVALLAFSLLFRPQDWEEKKHAEN